MRLPTIEIAMTLHDELGSMLTGAKMELEAIESKLAESPAANKIVKVKERMIEVMWEAYGGITGYSCFDRNSRVTELSYAWHVSHFQWS